MKKPCCTPTARLLDHRGTPGWCHGQERWSKALTHPSEMWASEVGWSGGGGGGGDREVKALQVSRWFGLGTMDARRSRMKLELHLGSAPLCVFTKSDKSKNRKNKKTNKIKPDKAEVTGNCSLCWWAKWMSDTRLHVLHKFYHSVLFFECVCVCCVCVCVTLAPKNKTCSWAPLQSALLAHHDWSMRFKISFFFFLHKALSP